MLSLGSSSLTCAIFLLIITDDLLRFPTFLPVTALLASSSTPRISKRLPHPLPSTDFRIIQTSLLSSATSDPYAEAASCFPCAKSITEEDRKVLQRQTGQVAPSVAALGIPSTCQCQHGYSQVFLLNPVGEKRMNSGLLKLTCPLLVNAIDRLEDDGYIANFTSQVQTNTEWKESCQIRHQTHADARKAILNAKSELDDSDSISILRQKLGDKGADAFLNSGIAGATAEKPDVKCLHAWMGDYLFHVADDDNSREHFLGEAIASVLQERNIPLTGTSDCHQFCNPSSSGAPVPKPRNKQRLKTQKEKDRRKRKKEREQTKAHTTGP